MAASTLFGPGSMMWRVNSEPVLLLGARPALLMQLAHPLVAAGVDQHSRFRKDPHGRLIATLKTISTIVYGTRAEALEAARRVNRMHSRVKGLAPDGAPYRATDPVLLCWVFATLVESAVRVYETFVCGLTDDEREELYTESKTMARLFGVPDAVLPATMDDLRAWMQELIDSREVAVTPLARSLARPIIRPTRLLPWWAAIRLTPALASLLPAEIRAGYELPLGRGETLALNAMSRTSRLVTPRAPRAAKAFAFKALP